MPARKLLARRERRSLNDARRDGCGVEVLRSAVSAQGTDGLSDALRAVNEDLRRRRML
jgi:hypothetical protein